MLSEFDRRPVLQVEKSGQLGRTGPTRGRVKMKFQAAAVVLALGLLGCHKVSMQDRLARATITNIQGDDRDVMSGDPQCDYDFHRMMYGPNWGASFCYTPPPANIKLSDKDSAMVRRDWEALQKAQNQWDNTRWSIRSGYLQTRSPDCAGSDPRTMCSIGDIPGFREFEFSEDFKFVVPGNPKP